MTINTITISASSNDLWGSTQYGLVVDTTTAYVGGTNLGSPNDPTRNWIPFVVNLPKNQRITVATLRVRATLTRSDAVTVNMGCESVVSPSTPSSLADLNGRVLTTAFTAVALEAYTNGNEYSYNFTAAVQEMLNHASWATGSSMALMMIRVSNDPQARRQIATVENASLAEPQLDISYEPFVPIGGLFL